MIVDINGNIINLSLAHVEDSQTAEATEQEIKSAIVAKSLRLTKPAVLAGSRGRKTQEPRAHCTEAHRRTGV